MKFFFKKILFYSGGKIFPGGKKILPPGEIPGLFVTFLSELESNNFNKIMYTAITHCVPPIDIAHETIHLIDTIINMNYINASYNSDDRYIFYLQSMPLDDNEPSLFITYSSIRNNTAYGQYMLRNDEEKAHTEFKYSNFIDNAHYKPGTDDTLFDTRGNFLVEGCVFLGNIGKLCRIRYSGYTLTYVNCTVDVEIETDPTEFTYNLDEIDPKPGTFLHQYKITEDKFNVCHASYDYYDIVTYCYPTPKVTPYITPQKTIPPQTPQSTIPPQTPQRTTPPPTPPKTKQFHINNLRKKNSLY